MLKNYFTVNDSFQAPGIKSSKWRRNEENRCQNLAVMSLLLSKFSPEIMHFNNDGRVYNIKKSETTFQSMISERN